MKNNRITFPQFLSLSFLSSMSFLFFVNNIPSVYLIVCVVLALSINLFVFILYRGQAVKFLVPLCGVYLTLYCAVVIAEFADYMYKTLSYEPVWLIVIILAVFSFFCTVKGIEALARASAIISFFSLAGIIYMFACTFSGMKFEISGELPPEILSAAVLLLPSVIYVINYDNIIYVKKTYYFIASGIMLAVYLYFILISSGVKSLYPIQYLPANSSIGVFKGADCILLSILTISALYGIASSATGLFKYFKHNYITNSVYVAAAAFTALIIHSANLLNFINAYVLLPFTLLLILVIILISITRYQGMYKNS